MVLDAVSNFVRGTADAEVGTSDTTVSVDDASIFPDPSTDGEFNVVIWDVNNFPRPDQDGDVEILRVTERDTTADELTVTRAQEMTSAAAHPEGSAIHLSPTAKMFSDIESTFDDFWDAGAQELTGDVNNTNTTTTALEAEKTTPGYLIENIAKDSVRVNSILPAPNIRGQKRSQATDVVADNSSVEVLDGSNTQLSGGEESGTLRGYLAVVVGQLEDEPNPHFTDIVNGAFGGSIDVISSVSRGTPPARSYSDGFDLELAIDGSGETYNVSIIALGGGRT